MSYAETYAKWMEAPEQFWAEAAEDVFWYRKWDRVLDDSNPPFYRWFQGGITNTCYNALDLHVENGRGGQLALVYDSPVTDSVREFTYRELLDEVRLFAGVLHELGVRKGDRVIIYMPLIPEGVISMLACARIGAVHSVVFGGFAANELASRINDAQPKVILSASCGIEGTRVIPYKPLLDKAIELSASKPEHCVIYQRSQETASLVEGRDLDWMELRANAKPVECVMVAATDPLYILYTSGTTGLPKGIVRDNGGHIVALKIMGRTDDIINVAGHRLSTGSMEEVLASHPDVAECAVVGVADALKGEVPVGFVLLKAGVERSHADIERELIEIVRSRIGPVACFKSAAVVKRLPKTRSGKMLRGTIKKIADSTPYRVPPTIDDPTTLDEMKDVLQEMGYAKSP